MNTEPLDFEISDGPFIWRMVPDGRTRELLVINATNKTYELPDDLTVDETKWLIGELVKLYFEMDATP